MARYAIRSSSFLRQPHRCPSSADLGHFVGFREGGSGSLGVEVIDAQFLLQATICQWNSGICDVTLRRHFWSRCREA